MRSFVSLSPYASSMRKGDEVRGPVSESKTLLFVAHLRDVTMTCCTATLLAQGETKAAPPSGRRSLPLQRPHSRNWQADEEEAEGRQSHVEEEVLQVPDLETRLSLSSTPPPTAAASRQQQQAAANFSQLFGGMQGEQPPAVQPGVGAGVGSTGDGGGGGIDGGGMSSQDHRQDKPAPSPRDPSGGLEVELHVRCGTGVVTRISVAHLKRLLAISQASAASLASLSSLFRHSDADANDTKRPERERAHPQGGGVRVATRAAVAGGAAGKDSLFSGLLSPVAASTCSSSPNGAVEELRRHRWDTLLLKAFRCASFKTETMRLVFEECRDGGALGFLRLPLFSCRIEALDVTASQHLERFTSRLLQPEQRAGGSAVAGEEPAQDAANEVAKVRANVALGVWYLNRSIGEWEPLLERCSLAAHASLDAPLVLLARAEEAKALRVAVSAKDVVNINISTALVDVAATAVKHATTAVAAPASPVLGGRRRKQGSEAFHPLWVRNDLGLPIVVRCGDQVQQIGAQGKEAVTCVPLVQSAGLLHGLPMLSVSSLHVHLPLEILTLWRAAGGAGAVTASEVGATIRLDVIGRQVLILQVGVEPRSSPFHVAVPALHAVKIVIDVLLEEGGASKVIWMRSPLTITNKLSTQLAHSSLTVRVLPPAQAT